MSQQINDNFQLLAALSLDDRYKQPTISARDAISSSRRFQGLLSFVEQTGTLYMLIGGVANSNWKGIAGSDTSNDIETIIEGFYVLLAGKQTPLDWEVNDKFRGWIGNRYVVGTILSLPVSLPSDIDDVSKVELALDSSAISGNNFPPQWEEIADGLQNEFIKGTTANAKQLFLDSALLRVSDWSQDSTKFTLTFTPASGQVLQAI